jgi:hypothetical protein
VVAVSGGSLRLQGGINAGGSTVSYQWYKNGVAVPGGTSPELAVPAVTGNAGSYWVQAVSGKATIRGHATAAVVDSANLSQARGALHVRDFSTASNKLNLALAANPVDGAALFLRSALDLYNLWSDPGVATNLAALGFTGSADPLNSTLRWSAEGFPKGALSAPVRAWLLGNGVKTEIHYPIAPHRQKAMQGILSGDFPIADVLHQTELSLPISFGHTHGDMRRICEAVARFDTRQ